MTVVEKPALTRASVVEAAARIAPHIRRTPTERSPALSQLAGRDVYLKLENLQRTGAFKIRGALNALMRLDAARRAAGVVTASAGNHGQGVAFAAQLVGAPATVVLPQGVPLAKLTAIQRSGAETVLATTLDERTVCLAAVRPERLAEFRRDVVHLVAEGIADRVEAEPQIS